MPVESQHSNFGQRWRLRRVTDLVIYLLIALIVGFGIIWFTHNSHGASDDFIAKWGGLALNTAILYGYVVKDSRPFWHVWGFWLATVSILTLHLILFAIVLLRTDQWSTLWFVFMYPIELPILLVACDWAVHITGKPKSEQS